MISIQDNKKDILAIHKCSFGFKSNILEVLTLLPKEYNTTQVIGRRVFQRLANESIREKYLQDAPNVRIMLANESTDLMTYGKSGIITYRRQPLHVHLYTTVDQTFLKLEVAKQWRDNRSHSCVLKQLIEVIQELSKGLIRLPVYRHNMDGIQIIDLDSLTYQVNFK